jgi:2-oxoglutarate dehydrogenase E2 component (dihydrolipoamide succinyltransferase)
MPTDVIMPQMGESIFEGTITKWLKKPGEKVQRDEPLFEISTDKVDAEIPAPAGGVLREIKVKEGTTVQVNTVVGVIDVEGSAVAAVPAAPTSPQPAQAAPAHSVSRPPDGVSVAPATPAPARPASHSGNGGGSSGGTQVVMPQMGESIFEGTITKWLKKVGEHVQRDEPLFEISTDKVDAEIPSPSSGVLNEIKVKEGTTVQVNTVVAIIGGAPAAYDSHPDQVPVPPALAPAPRPMATSSAMQASLPTPQPAPSGERIRSSPLVKSIARKNNVRLDQVPGTGMGGRITKNDILNFIQQHGAAGVPRVEPPALVLGRPPAPTTAPTAPIQPPTRVPIPSPPPAAIPKDGDLEPMSAMRITIARRMLESKRTSAHVHTVFKVDMTRIVKFRDKVRKGWEERHGVKLTFMPFVAKALMHGIRKKRVVNASVVGEGIFYHKHVNIGIAVALDWGLIVPVVKGAENLSFVGLQRAISDLGERARAKKLVPDEVQGGTITITNPGIYGPQFGMPIIMQPQVAILGMGGIFKEPVVVTDEDGNDSIAVRHIIRLTLGYDHRIIDGADADQFMVAVREYLESFNEDIG